MMAKTVTRRVAELLQRKRPLSYADIAAKVRDELDAKTSPRGVASVASSLRAAGIPLPDRRQMAH